MSNLHWVSVSRPGKSFGTTWKSQEEKLRPQLCSSDVISDCVWLCVPPPPTGEEDSKKDQKTKKNKKKDEDQASDGTTSCDKQKL